MSVEIFGHLFHGGVIETAVIDRLKLWLPHYLNEVCEQHSHGPVKGPQSFATASEFSKWPEQGLPAVIVMAPGTDGEPEKDGAGYYTATWRLAVAVECSAASGAVARTLAQLYGAAVRGSLLQRRSLGDEMQVADWLGEATDTVSVEDRRTRVAVENAFSVTRREVITTHGGPATDEPPGPDAWPLITEANVEVEPT